MAIGNDDPIALPKAPPPRPAARQAAIDAALRKFDGVEDAAPAPRRRPGWIGWASTHRGPASALATAAIVAVVGLPIALATLRDMPRSAPQQPAAPTAVQPAQDAIPADSSALAAPAENQSLAEAAEDQAPADEAPAAERAPPRPAPMALAPVAQKVTNQEVAPAMAAAPPPPPPPPPTAPAPQREEGYAAESDARDMVVTGSRIRSPEMSDRANRQAVGKSSPLVTMDNYGDFLSRLQSAVRADNRRAVSRLVGFPLTVNTKDGAKTYRSRREVESDFDRVFTPAVKAEILGLKPHALRTRDDGETKGFAKVWFSPACFNAECDPPGPIRIREITP